MATAIVENSVGASPRISGARPLRVLHVIPHLGSGGAERFVLTLLRKLHPSVCTNRLCVLGAIKSFSSRARFDEPTVTLGYNGSLKRPMELLRCIARLRRLIRNWDADIVHSHLWPAARIAAVAARGTGVQHVVHVQDTRPWVSSSELRSRFYRLLTRAALSGGDDCYVAVSRAAAEYNAPLLARSRQRVLVIPNAVDTDEFSPRMPGRPPGGRLRIGVAARLDPEKGHPYLLHALARVIAGGRQVELLLAGEGSERPRLENLSRQLGIDGQVRFVGLVDDVAAFLRTLDLFVLPSVAAEGLPLSILEAMATGVPVIATDVAGAGEVVRDGVNGILVPPRDVDALAGALVRLADDPGLRRKLAAEAVGVVRDEYTFDAVAGRIADLYLQMNP